MARLPVAEIERLIYPVGFYRNKARHVKACCEMLVADFDGRVPSTMEELVTLPGVGRKTANLVLILGFKSQREHLRGHPRPSHLESHGLGSHLGSGGDRAGALPGDTRAVVAGHQSLSCDVGTERLPSRSTALRRIAPSLEIVDKLDYTKCRMRTSTLRSCRPLSCSLVRRWKLRRLREPERNPHLVRSPRPRTPAPAAAPRRSPGAGPIIVFETMKGTFRDRDVSERGAQDCRAHPGARQAKLL